jgi:tetratricopeptide (TPR) repeat protein
LTYYYLGLAYERTREFPQSIDSYTTAMGLNPDKHLQVFILHDRAIAKGEYRDLQGAIADIDMELQLDPTAEGAYANRARVHFEMADYQNTIADVDKVVELMGSARYVPDLIDIKAQSYIALNEHKKAVQTMQNLVDLVGPENREYAKKRLQEIKALAGE